MVDNKMPTHVQFFSLMVISFCIKEPLYFTRVPQIEVKFPGEGGNPPYTYPHVHAADDRSRFASSLAGSISKTNFLGRTLIEGHESNCAQALHHTSVSYLGHNDIFIFQPLLCISSRHWLALMMNAPHLFSEFFHLWVGI